MASVGGIHPYYVREVVNSSIIRFSWSDKLLAAVDVKLERLKFAIFLMIADMCWIKKQEPDDAKT